MPDPLTVKRPKPINNVTAWILGVPLAFIVMWFFRLLDRREDIHFENPWLNLAVHSALILVPILLSASMWLQGMEFAPTEETVICYSGYLNTFRTSWWTLLPVWPPGIFAAFILLRDLFTEYLPHPEVLTTSPLRGLMIVGATLGVSLLYTTTLFHRFGVRISAAGIRPSLIRFLEWQNIHHVRPEGEIYSFYQRAQPNLPISFIPVRNGDSKAVLDRLLSEHNIPLSKPAGRVLMLTKVVVLAGFIVNLLLCFWLRFGMKLGLLPTIGISLAIGMIANLALDKFRGVGKLSKFSPKIDSPRPEQ